MAKPTRVSQSADSQRDRRPPVAKNRNRRQQHPRRAASVVPDPAQGMRQHRALKAVAPVRIRSGLQSNGPTLFTGWACSRWWTSAFPAHGFAALPGGGSHPRPPCLASRRHACFARAFPLARAAFGLASHRLRRAGRRLPADHTRPTGTPTPRGHHRLITGTASESHPDGFDIAEQTSTPGHRGTSTGTVVRHGVLRARGCPLGPGTAERAATFVAPSGGGSARNERGRGRRAHPAGRRTAGQATTPAQPHQVDRTRAAFLGWRVLALDGDLSRRLRIEGRIWSP